MSTIKLSIFAYFSEFEEDGISYMAVKPDMLYAYNNDEDSTYVAEIDVPLTDNIEVIKMGAAKIDKEIIDLQVQITQKEEKKKQLLAIEYKGES